MGIFYYYYYYFYFLKWFYIGLHLHLLQEWNRHASLPERKKGPILFHLLIFIKKCLHHFLALFFCALVLIGLKVTIVSGLNIYYYHAYLCWYKSLKKCYKVRLTANAFSACLWKGEDSGNRKEIFKLHFFYISWYRFDFFFLYNLVRSCKTFLSTTTPSKYSQPAGKFFKLQDGSYIFLRYW